MDRPIYGHLWLLLTDIAALPDPGPQIPPSGSQPFLPGTWRARLPRPSAVASAPVSLTPPGEVELLTPRARPPAQPLFWASTRSPTCGSRLFSHLFLSLLLPQEWKSKIHIETTGSFHFILIPCPQTFLRGKPEPLGHSCFLWRIL